MWSELAHGPAIESSSMALHGGYIYWTSGNSVMRLPIGGGASTTLLSGLNAPQFIGIDAASVYWGSGDGSVMKAPLAGGPQTQLASGDPVRGLAIDADNVYWTTYRMTVPANADGTVMKIPLGGGTATESPTDCTNPLAMYQASRRCP